MRTKTVAIRAVQLVLAVLLAANAAYYALGYFCPSLAGYLLSVIGRNPACSAGEAAQGIDWHVAQNLAIKRITSQVRLVRAEGEDALWDTPQGRWWTPNGGKDRGQMAVLLAQQEVHIYGSGADGPGAGDTVLDCGAHVGVFTRQALAQGSARVVAIEPNPDNVECLQRNFAREIAAGRVIVYAKGVWDKEDRLTFHSPPGQSAGGSFLLQSRSGDRPLSNIPVTTIDALVSELNLARVDFIKMDIKAATERALRGAQGTIRRHRPRLAIATEEASYDDPTRISAVLRELWHGYRSRCGSCFVTNLRVHPEVVFFHP